PEVVTTATNNDGDGIIVDPSKLCDSAPCKNGATCRTTSTTLSARVCLVTMDFSAR
ncbi:hypothetical protein BOX15_Mlig018549g1, partial [Macrostomum lignano]